MATTSSTPRKTTSRARKAAPAKAVEPKASDSQESTTSNTATERYSFELEYVPADERLGKTTKQGNTVKNVRSEKFIPPAGSGVQGQLYFPLGTRRVKITFLSE